MTSYAVSNNINDLIASLEKSSKGLFKRFDDDLIKRNHNKCHLLVSSCEKTKMEIVDFEIETSTCE